MKFVLPLLLIPVVSLAYLEAEAQACGGCFVPSENNTVVTDHRMVLAVSPQQSTLYDQIRYQGDPSSFAWVLPIKGVVKVGISSDAVFSVLDTSTSVQVFAPPINCPGPSDCDQRFASADNAGSASDGGAPVSVLKEETVGPYETVQLRSTDPQALTNWLTSRGYTITPEIAPVISGYVAEQFDFLALKLVPGTGIRSMRPVRVTTPGAGVSLPLRMVAAGTGPQVGITLWVLGDGRWEPQNFPSFTVKEEDLVWDWTTSASNFKSVRARKNSDLGGSAWEQESSVTLDKDSVVSQVRFAAQARGIDAAEDYAPEKDAEGNVIKNGEAVLQEDMGYLVGSGRGAIRATRMRADLPQASLNNDLTLRASADQAELSRVRRVTREANEPLCPVYDECNVVGQAPRSEAAAGGTVWGGSGGCSTTKSSPLSSGLYVLGSALVLAFVAKRRRA